MDSNKEDVKTILELIKRFLPQFAATRDDLLKLNPSFVINFYKHYVNELANNCQLLLECNFENVMEFCPHGIDEEMFFLLFIQHTLKKIGVPYFTICDFYKPTNRTRTTMKICLNFLFYIKENLPRSKEIIRIFNEQAEGVQLRNERVCAKKNELSESTYRVGLLKGQLEELNMQYEAETNIETAIFESEAQLNKEIQQLEKRKLHLLNHVSLQGHCLNRLNEEIQVLSDQVVSDDHELCVKSLEHLQDKVKEDDCLISKNQEVLENKQKELEHLGRLHMQIQKIDISTLDYVEEIDSMKKNIYSMESDENDINEQKKIFEKMNQNIADIGKEYQEDVLQLESTLNENKEMIKLLDRKIAAEEMLQKGLSLELHQLKEKCGNSKVEIPELEKEQLYFEEECKRYYQRLITCLNSVTTTFNATVANSLAALRTSKE